MTATRPEPTVGAPVEAPADDPVGALFASSSVTEHVLRGVVGLVLAVASLALVGDHPWALLGLLGAIVAWRGCPTCWLMGLGQTLSRRGSDRVGCDTC